MATPTHLATDSFAHYPPIMAEAFARLAAQQAATEAQMQLTSRKVDALTESTQRMGEQLGGIANNQGSVAEEFFFNSLLDQPQIRPFTFTKVISNHLVGFKGQQTEFDLVLVNGDSVVVVEVKYKLHPAHIDRLTQQIATFKRLSPEFSSYSVYGALAGFSAPQAVIHAAAARGYMVLQRKGGQLVSHAEGLRAH
jgi:predicted glycoside hydrolase/deacetylase ChbG (UPF0249 family)